MPRQLQRALAYFTVVTLLCVAPTAEAGWATAKYIRYKLGLKGKRELNNRYLMMRHGPSQAMERSRVGDFTSPLSRPDGKRKIDGRQVVRDAITKAKGVWELEGTDTVIVSSKVLRALETAKIAQEVTGAVAFHEHEGLNERHYGNQHDRGSKNIRIPMVWGIDLLVRRPMEWITSLVRPRNNAWVKARKRDLPFTRKRDRPFTRKRGAESAFAVLDRTLDVIADMEKKYKGKTIILVSHLDPIFITWWALQGRAAETLPLPGYPGAADIRELKLR